MFVASVAPMTKHIDPASPETLFLILESGYLSRLQESPTEFGARYLSPTCKEKVEPPKRTYFVKPAYPEGARLARRTGKTIVEIVVNEKGLVSDMRLLKESEEDFVKSAFRAVAQWRYTPALFEGEPTTVYLTVIVEWRLR